ncbi:MAG: hypothetical protein WC356_02075 [Candidatus Micrarchaeia archaeon]|jgi:hypothetical protein
MREMKKWWLRWFNCGAYCKKYGHVPVKYACVVNVLEGGWNVAGEEQVWVENHCEVCGKYIDVGEKHFLRGLRSMSYNGTEMSVYGRCLISRRRL